MNRIRIVLNTKKHVKVKNWFVEFQIKCRDVVKAYIERIRTVNPIVNGVIDERFSEALRDAERVDKLVETATQEELDRYPLLGVPITVKGSISIAGLPNTSGLVGRREAESCDAKSLSLLRKAGAIPLLTSNVPELCLNWETRNRLVGVTKHPFNTNRSPGGSSGGEAALITSAASLIGIGSDVVGSLRLPSHFCGIFAHKPTPGVVSTHGHYPGSAETRQWVGIFTIGPLARFAGDLMVIFRVMVEPEARKLLRLEKPVDVGKLKVYYLMNCNTLLGRDWSPPVRRTFWSVLRDLDQICATKCKEVRFVLNYDSILLLKLVLSFKLPFFMQNCSENHFPDKFFEVMLRKFCHRIFICKNSKNLEHINARCVFQ